MSNRPPVPSAPLILVGLVDSTNDASLVSTILVSFPMDLQDQNAEEGILVTITSLDELANWAEQAFLSWEIRQPVLDAGKYIGGYTAITDEFGGIF